eukprot:CAMPEP_0174827590 /NCGR_PEP_ID=MMETSP1114-20130205/822_1 /TAXON_ID=312471 /ORGANISM="Neobodo designis, Strain CCAP 1951/1" /LENGTH=218 /DNA_ID=CAMNT_0016061257 /DNA_START=59 /DNA_END=715 /DNA_ORIENTATION=-
MASEDRQIQAMIEFIDRDAQEKVREYDDEAQALYDSEKANLVEAQKKKVIAATADAKKQLEVDRRVARAQVSKQERMRVMEARGEALDQVKQRTEQQVRQLVKDSTKYKQLLADLLRQSAIAIAADADVVCRKQDEGVVKGLLKQAEEAAQQACGKAVKLTLSKEHLDDEASWGGVTLKSAGGHKVICDNTLAARTAHCFDEQMPTVRHYLFHEKAHF